MLLRIFIVQGMPGRPEKTDQIYPGCLADVLLPGPKKKLTVLSSQLHVAILGRSCGTFEKGLQVKKNCCENLLSNFYRSFHQLQSAYPPCLLEHTQATALHLQSGLFLLQPAAHVAHVAHVVRTVQCPWIVPRNVLSILSHPTWMPSASASGSCHMLPHLPRCRLDSAHQGPHTDSS